MGPKPDSLEEVDVTTFVRQPVGRFVRGPRVAVWCISERLMGASLEGQLGADDLDIVLKTNRLTARLGRFDSILDAQRHTGFVPGTMHRWFVHGLGYIRAANGRLQRNVCVLPRGFELMVSVQGALKLAPIPWEQHVVQDLSEAFVTLGYRDEARSLSTAVRRLLATSSRTKRHRMTRREREVATLAAQGLSDLNIGQTLGISETTVGSHLTRVFRKLEVHSRVELANALRRYRGA